MNESMAQLVWNEYQGALREIIELNDELDRLHQQKAGILSQARDWKARTRILAKRCKSYEDALQAVADAKEDVRTADEIVSLNKPFDPFPPAFNRAAKPIEPLPEGVTVEPT